MFFFKYISNIQFKHLYNMSTINISINCIHHIYKLKDASGHQYFTSSRNTFHLLLTEIFQFPSQQRDRFPILSKESWNWQWCWVRSHKAKWEAQTLQTQKQNYIKTSILNKWNQLIQDFNDNSTLHKCYTDYNPYIWLKNLSMNKISKSPL